MSLLKSIISEIKKIKIIEDPFVEIKTSTELKKINLNNLLKGKVFIIKKLPEVLRLKELISHRISNSNLSDKIKDNIYYFFDNHRSENLDIESLSCLSSELLKIKNERLITKIFSSLINSLNLSNDIYVDCGHFRFCLPNLYNKIISNKRIFGNFCGHHVRDITDLQVENDEGEPILVNGPNNEHIGHTKLFSRVHRDIICKHSHLQLNFWFALHELSKKECLEIYPREYHNAQKEYLKSKTVQSFQAHDYYGRKYQRKLDFGDCLLFHSQVFHETPRENPIQNRLSVELRAGINSSDNIYHYRKLFVNLKNFN